MSTNSNSLDIKLTNILSHHQTIKEYNEILAELQQLKQHYKETHPQFVEKCDILMQRIMEKTDSESDKIMNLIESINNIKVAN